MIVEGRCDVRDLIVVGEEDEDETGMFRLIMMQIYSLNIVNIVFEFEYLNLNI